MSPSRPGGNRARRADYGVDDAGKLLRGIKSRVQAPLEHYVVDIDGDAN
jgi:hypothetical protein